MYKAFEYRLYPNREQHKLLVSCLAQSRRIYNEMLELVKARYAESGEVVPKRELREWSKGRGGMHVPASTVQVLADRLDKALWCLLGRNKRGERAGFPRFKGPNRWHSIALRQWAKGKDVWLEGSRLRVPGKLGGSIKIKLHRPMEGTPKTATLVLRADGKWYVLVVCDLGDAPPKRKGEAVGLDVGLRFFLTDSKGETVGNPRCYRNSQKKLRPAHRRVCRRKRGSNRRKKAARRAAKQHLKIARQRRDFLHKTARRYVDRYALIAVEDLNVGGLLRNRRVAKAISDASWSEFIRILEQKAESAAVRVVRVSPRSTSQRCSRCGETVRKSLSVRRHACPSCGYVTDRDHNAARNILASARAGPSERNAGGCPERAPRSLRP